MKANEFMIRFVDLGFSSIAIMITAPLIVVTILMAWIFIGYPPFFVSRRKGKDGIVFNHIKIRSMLPGKEIGRVFFELDRVNWCGRFLRKFHLDEFPELFLILSGKMSLVGPRPLLLKSLEPLGDTRRETVMPGITGPAQVYLLKHGLLNKFLQVRLDEYYVTHRSLIYNLRLLWATMWYFVFGKKTDLAPDSTADRILFQKNEFKYIKKT